MGICNQRAFREGSGLGRAQGREVLDKVSKPVRLEPRGPRREWPNHRKSVGAQCSAPSSPRTK